jgi:hypothetical protein
MVDTTSDATARIIELSDVAYRGFCRGISSMFDVAMRCRRQQAGIEAARGLRGRFPELTSVHVLAADGVLKGTLYLLFDQTGLFVLPGTVIMLPKGRILEQVKRGSLETTASQEDAAREIGNLLVGSWDRTFRDECQGHKHFLKKASLIGRLWEKPDQMELSVEDQVLLILYQMTLEPYPDFTGAAVLPVSMLAGIDGAGMDHPSEARKS